MGHTLSEAASPRSRNSLKFVLVIAFSAALPALAAPPVSLIAGGSLLAPQGASASSTASAGYGTRIGLSFPFSLHAGDLEIPVEWGMTLRTSSIRFEDVFDRTVFTDLQVPVLFHGAPTSWKPFELLAVWTPSYTLDLVSTASDGRMLAGADDLRTRFNMGFGAGVQVGWRGIRMRGYGAYNIFPPFAGSETTFSDWVFEIALPLVWSRPSKVAP
jgi:hypothetical protein